MTDEEFRDRMADHDSLIDAPNGNLRFLQMDTETISLYWVIK